MINVLNEAIFSIKNTLIKQENIIIKNYVITNIEGSANYSLVNQIHTKAHIQPFTPREIKKYTETTIDSAFNYKFFILGKNVRVIYSNNVKLENSIIIWDKKEFRSYGIRDWSNNSINGWICIYAGF